jgi:guanine nucleotide-binding protein subunit beta-2-like 1 protein
LLAREPAVALCQNTASSLTYSTSIGTDKGIKIWDLDNKVVVADLTAALDGATSNDPSCLSLAWSADGSTLFSGWSDAKLRVWEMS